MSKTIADTIRHVKVYPEDLGMATLIEKVRKAENVIAVVTHQDKTKTVIEVATD